MYAQEDGYANWRRDMEELFQNLDEIKVHGTNGIKNQHTSLDDLLAVTVGSALFNTCWSPALEQKQACILVRDIKNRIRDKFGLDDENMRNVLGRLDDVLSFEEEDDDV